ncbi:MAG: cytochrome c biogenesis protein CcsA [Deltaproteobacteria bacterium]|nr:cytochrome c biogenesis protein CcsA [Deltaproteobacteria bacterium]
MDPGLYLWTLRGASALLLALAVFALGRRSASAWLAAAGAVPGLLPAAARTFQVGHLPLAGLHETLLTFGVCFPLVSALACLRRGAVRAYGLCLMASAALLGLATLAPVRPTPLVPALQTLWFEVHVTSSFFAYACFGLGACAAVLELGRVGQGQEAGIIASAHRWGFAWFTWAMVSGGIWAYLAWGTYWLWHVKELWSGILWTYYAGAVHLPYVAGWRGRRQAGLSLVGFGLVLFTYLGVGLFMRNTHQF